MLTDVKSLSPSSHYALAVGCHGYGWLPKSAFASKGKQQRLLTVSAGDDAGFPTRFFGGTQTDWQIDITDFAEGIKMSGLHFDYILFDDCYMASIEAIYDLRHLTDYVVASPCEMMAAGLPYASIGQHLLGTPDLKALCDGFYDFYSSYRMPYGTLSVVDCHEMDNLAALMKRINITHTIDDSEARLFQTGSVCGSRRLCRTPYRQRRCIARRIQETAVENGGLRSAYSILLHKLSRQNQA